MLNITHFFKIISLIDWNEETEKRFSSFIEYYNFDENDEMTEEESQNTD